MQRMGGGGCPCSTVLKGGGNNPSCGCDMQAGWPSATELPRGGIQGGGSTPVCGSCPFPGTGVCDFYAKGGHKRRGGCGTRRGNQAGGGCPCTGGLLQGGGTRKGGYRATKRNLKYLNKWRKGKSIGFTMTSSLKAKGLIPRTSKTHKGKRVVSRKYK